MNLCKLASRDKVGFLSKILAALFMALLLASCGGANTPDRSGNQAKTSAAVVSATSADLTVIGIKKVNETRVDRTRFDYVFSVTIKNGGDANVERVSATLITVGAGASIVDGSVEAGSIGAGLSVTPADTITIRQDRSLPFASAALVWQINMVAPPSGIGILLPGNPSDAASAHRQDYRAQRTPADLQTAQSTISDARYYRTQLMSSFSANATVGKVNEALNSVNGRIVVMWADNDVVTIQVPDPGTPEGLDSIAAKLDASGAFVGTGRMFIPVANRLPINVTQPEAIHPQSLIRHHLAANFAPAWSAVNIKTDSSLVEVIVIDYFGRGALNPALLGGSATGYGSGFKCYRKDQNGQEVEHECEHGYHVLGIINADFGGASTQGGKITGASPEELKVHIVDLAAIPTGTDHYEYMKTKLAAIVSNSPQSRFVINMSLGYCGSPTSCLTPAQAAVGGAKWRKLMRGLTAGFNFDERAIQVTSAGNGGPNTSALLNSAWNAAVLAGRLEDQSPFVNGLVVENRTVIDSGGVPKIGPPSLANDCELYGSTRGGNIGAVGTHVWSFSDPNGNVKMFCGTSMATPQVAGLAAHMLAVADTLATKPSVALVVDHIKKGTVNPDIPAAPPINAYASLLRLDTDLALATVRRAVLHPLLGANPAGLVNFAQAKLFLQAFYRSAYNLTDNVLPDFSEFNLNGSGFTGDPTKKTRFKLDPGKSTFDVLTQYPNGIPVKIDENSVSDLEILCYYVNGPLFDPSQRQLFYEELQMISTKLGRTISCSDPVVTLDVQSTNPGWTGLPAHIEISNFAIMPVFYFQLFGDPMNTCATGERGSPLFSSVLPPDATLWAGNVVRGLPENIGGAGVNRRPCSTFYASAPSGQVWINATGRGQAFSGQTVRDWEIQIRYSNGDLNGTGRRCEVGVVPNANFFNKNFDATCTHDVELKVTY